MKSVNISEESLTKEIDDYLDSVLNELTDLSLLDKIVADNYIEEDSYYQSLTEEDYVDDTDYEEF